MPEIGTSLNAVKKAVLPVLGGLDLVPRTSRKCADPRLRSDVYLVPIKDAPVP